ncbi:MAG: HAMP domain-containing protein [Thermomicrobia bacterium]|nr:HAMP domain-containing protein [Thermomicrobia bacterium]
MIAILQPPMMDVGKMAVFLSVSGLLSLGVMGADLWLMQTRALRTIRARIVGALAAGSVVALINVLFSALLMFASRHDVLLLALLSFFGVVVSVALGAVLAGSLTDRLHAVTDAAAALAAGDLSVRVPPPTADAANEVRALTVAFNRMAIQLEAAARRRTADDEARRMLVAAISHDLRTPLASIRAMIEAITDGVVTDAETIGRFHATMGREIRTLSALITDLFELSQLDAGQLALSLAPATISALITEVVEGLAAQAAARDVHIASGVEGAVGPVIIDTPAVRRVLTNLVQNALRHTPPDGTVAVTARAVADRVQVDVVDTGEGIPATDLPHVFERFYRGEKSRSRETGGAGLGLAIARGFVEAHGGRIWVESEAGRGTRFSFILPRT